jgi:hypothetical protein
MMSVVLSVFLFILFSSPLLFNHSPPYTYSCFLYHIPVNTDARRSSQECSLLNQLHMKYCFHFRRVCKIAKSDYQLRHLCLSVRPSLGMKHLGSQWTDFHVKSSFIKTGQ